ncbi:hypothetical protein NRK67_08905 [Fusobacteria bacterium ZRK30]|nr:hypothetical protein NRK67_08905 [Fusobacteria bacterium ZRK30]
MRTKTIKADYDIALPSVMIVLENQGYTVENTDIVQGAYGSKSAKDIDDPAVYGSLFNELRTETERMKAINYTSIYEELRTELERVKSIK